MLSSLVVAALSIQPLLVGVSTVSITPPEPLPLGGYTQRGGTVFQPGGDDLSARTVVLRQKSTTVAITSVEMLTVPESLYREVKKRLPSDVNLFLAATHTHSAPDSQMLNERMTIPVPGIATYKSRWLEWYADRIATGVREALAEPAWKRSVTVNVAHLDLNRGRRLGAWPDNAFTQVSLDGVEINHFAAHATFHGPERLGLTGDWPGAMGMVLAGPIGDVSPAASGANAEEKISNFRTVVESGLASKKPFPLSPTSLAFKTVTLKLPPAKPHPTFAAVYGAPNALAKMIVGRFAPTEAQISGFRLGALAVIGIPGEPTSHLGRAIRNEGWRLGFKYVLVCSHVNGWMGYILGPEDYDRGGYEATLSFYGREQGDAVVEAAKGLLGQLRQVY
jgi:neutral ceramidase